MPLPRTLARIATAGLLAGALAGCTMTTEERDMLVGAGLGAGAGLLTASVLGADRNWTVITTLGAAAAGALVARNRATGQCAYAVGDGTFRTGPCPR